MSRNHWTNRTRRAFCCGTVLSLTLALTGMASADVVYSWTDDQGTRSFTDDAKNIPSRYADRVAERSLESLRSYPRLTIETHARPARTAPVSAPAPIVTERAEPASAGLSVLVGGTRFGANATVVPVGRQGEDEAPTLIETYRVQPRDSMATTHETVISQGGRVISIQRDELSQADFTGMVPPVRPSP